MATGRLEGLKVFMGWAGAPVGGAPRARLAFQQHVDPRGFAPEDFNVLQREIKTKVPGAPLRLCLALLRLSSHDTEVYWKLHRRVLQTSRDPEMSVTVDRDAAIDVGRLAQGNFPVVQRHDVLFEAGRWMMVLRRFDIAAQLLERSLQLHGEHYVTHHNLGICRFRCGDVEGALEAFDACLRLKPRYKEARAWFDRVHGKLSATSSSGQGGSRPRRRVKSGESGGDSGAGRGYDHTSGESTTSTGRTYGAASRMKSEAGAMLGHGRDAAAGPAVAGGRGFQVAAGMGPSLAGGI